MLLANILDAAVEYELLPTNPARGGRRRLKAARPTRRFLEADEHGEVLAAASELDRGSVDLHHKRLVIEQSKPDAGVRAVDLSLDLLDELLAWRADSAPEGVDSFISATASGRPRDKDSARERVLAPVIRR